MIAILGSILFTISFSINLKKLEKGTEFYKSAKFHKYFCFFGGLALVALQFIIIWTAK